MSTGKWINVASAADIGPDQMKAVQVGPLSIAVFNVGGGFYATTNVCTHGMAYLTEGWLEDGVIECPLHAGQFDVRTGKGLGPPISCDLRTFQTRTAGDDIEILIE